MAVRDKDAAAELRGLARSMFFSKEVIDGFLEGASAAQARCVADLIARCGVEGEEAAEDDFEPRTAAPAPAAAPADFGGVFVEA